MQSQKVQNEFNKHFFPRTVEWVFFLLHGLLFSLFDGIWCFSVSHVIALIFYVSFLSSSIFCCCCCYFAVCNRFLYFIYLFFRQCWVINVRVLYLFYLWCARISFILSFGLTLNKYKLWIYFMNVKSSLHIKPFCNSIFNLNMCVCVCAFFILSWKQRFSQNHFVCLFFWILFCPSIVYVCTVQCMYYFFFQLRKMNKKGTIKRPFSHNPDVIKKKMFDGRKGPAGGVMGVWNWNVLANILFLDIVRLLPKANKRVHNFWFA